MKRARKEIESKRGGAEIDPITCTPWKAHTVLGACGHVVSQPSLEKIKNKVGKIKCPFCRSISRSAVRLRTECVFPANQEKDEDESDSPLQCPSVTPIRDVLKEVREQR